MISFQPKWYEQIKNGKKIYEYRTQFPKEPVVAYMYVSKPVQAIVGYVEFGERIPLSKWADIYKNDVEISQRIEEYMTRRKFVAPILSYTDTVPISLDDINRNLSKFIIPQSYYYLDNYPELFEYIKSHTVFKSYKVTNDFSVIDKNQICSLRS